MIHRVRRSPVPIHALLGAALILASCESNLTGTGGVTGVTVTASSNEIRTGTTLQLIAAVAPSTAPQAVTWSSSSGARATVDATGLVTAVSVGTVTITATSTEDPSRSGSLQLTVLGCTPLVQANVINGGTLVEGTCYEVQGALSVNSGTLTVQRGVRVEFGSNGQLSINTGGSLNAVGLDTQPIVFTSIDPVGSWRGISFNASRSIGNVLRHVTIRNGGSSGWTGGDQNRAALYLNGNALVNIQYTTIEGSGGQGINVREGVELIFENSTLRNNAVAAWVHPNTAGYIGGTNVFQDNTDNVVRVGFGNGDRIETAQTWRAGVPFEVQYRFYVEAGLTLDPGVRIASRTDVDIIVQNGGALNAVGTSSSPITFTDVTNLTGNWKGLQIRTAAAGNRFEHVIFENGGSAQWTGIPDSRAMVYLEGNSRALFRNSTFRGSAHYGLWVPSGGNIDGFDGNTFTGNARAMIVSPVRAGSIAANNTFVGNTENKVRVSFNLDQTLTSADGWNDFGAPFYITVVTRIHAPLTIAAGTEVEFAQDASLEVSNGGSLRVAGAADNRVVFRGGEDVVGYWKGIQYNTVSAGNVLQYVDFSNGGSAEWYGGGNAAATVYVGDDGNASLSNVTFARTGGYAMIVWNGGVACSAVNPGGAMFRIKTGLVYSNVPTC